MDQNAGPGELFGREYRDRKRAGFKSELLEQLRGSHWKVRRETHGGAAVAAVPSGAAASRSITQGQGNRGESGARRRREALADLFADLLRAPAPGAGDGHWGRRDERASDDVQTCLGVLRVVY